MNTISDPVDGIQSKRQDLEPQSSVAPDLTECDRELINVPGSIQPHGLLLIADPETLVVVAGAGDIEGRLNARWFGQALGGLICQDMGVLLALSEPAGSSAVKVHGISEEFDLSLHRADGLVLAELEPAANVLAQSATTLATLDRVGSVFGRALTVTALCEEAALVFREATGFDRVMIYRFLDNEAGCVVAEAKAPQLHSFLNHHFPATDIPRQARALYIRNRVRVIPDVAYQPAPLRPAFTDYVRVALKALDEAVARSGATQIYIETPYRNDALLAATLAACRATTELCVAAELTLPTEQVIRRPIARWRDAARIELYRRPAIFLLGTI